jgi:hypothetical protein
MTARDDQIRRVVAELDVHIAEVEARVAALKALLASDEIPGESDEVPGEEDPPDPDTERFTFLLGGSDGEQLFGP